MAVTHSIPACCSWEVSHFVNYFVFDWRQRTKQNCFTFLELVDCFYRWLCEGDISFCILFRYNNLFRFLLKVKRTQLDLQQVWAVYMGTKHLTTAQLSNMTKIWLSRMHMAFLVDNLQYYLQVINFDLLDLSVPVKNNKSVYDQWLWQILIDWVYVDCRAQILSEFCMKSKRQQARFVVCPWRMVRGWD